MSIGFLISTCDKPEYSEAWFNESCKHLGYDMAIPVYIDDEPTGANCCLINGDKVNCEEFYSKDELNMR